MSTFQPLIPTGDVNLDEDYKNIQGNFQQLDTSFGIDHLPFSNGTAQNGYHTSIHQVPFPNPDPIGNPNNWPDVGEPAAVTDYGQIFSAIVNDGFSEDTALFYLSGDNNRTVLTRNFATTMAQNGYTFLPGGMVLQWGIATTNSNGDATITFTKVFNNFYAGFLSRIQDSVKRAFTQFASTPTTTSAVVKIQDKDATGISSVFYWIAIGD